MTATHHLNNTALNINNNKINQALNHPFPCAEVRHAITKKNTTSGVNYIINEYAKHS